MWLTRFGVWWGVSEVAPRDGVFQRRSTEPVTRRNGTSPAVQDGIHAHDFLGCLIVDRKREPLGQKPVVTPVGAVNAGVEMKRLDVCEEGVDEVFAQPGG